MKAMVVCEYLWSTQYYCTHVQVRVLKVSIEADGVYFDT